MPFSEHPEHLGGVGYYNKLPARTVTQNGSTWTIDNTKGFFGFVKLVPNIVLVEETGSDGVTHQRCDGDKDQYGPLAFHVWDEDAGECNCGADTPPHILTGNHDLPFNELVYLSAVFGGPHCGGQVVYIESSDTAAEERVVTNRHSAATRTIQELLRLMMEWEVAGSDFGSTEPMVSVCTDMLSGLAMPDDVRNWIWTNVPPNKVQKYLEGRTDAQTADTPPDISGTIVEDWLVPLITEAPQIGFMPTGDGS